MKNIDDSVFNLFGCGYDEAQREYYVYGIGLVEEVLDGVKLEDSDGLMGITDRVMKLPIGKRFHFIFCLLDNYVASSPEFFSVHGGLSWERNQSLIESGISDSVSKFLGQECFIDVKDVLLVLFDDDISDEDRKSKVVEFENRLGVKIIYDEAELIDSMLNNNGV